MLVLLMTMIMLTTTTMSFRLPMHIVCIKNDVQNGKDISFQTLKRHSLHAVTC
jgi:hypothetical protein